MALNSIDAIVTDPPYGLNFMGKNWDHGVPGAHFWVEALRVAKPGAHLLAFGGTRTFHRLVCAIEDAGFEIRDTIMWVYGSGFPKSRNLEGEWDGWGTALKPAWEPIIVARKPLDGTVAANVAKYGTGALNIDGCRIEYDGDADKASATPQGKCTAKSGALAGGVQHEGGRSEFTRPEQKGRWPANVVHDGSDEVVALFPAEAGASAPVRGTEPSRPAKNTYGEFARGGGAFHGDTGSAARFFYCAKADRHDRNDGCEELPARDLNWSSGKQSPGTFQSENTDRSATNFHPTVKPTDLMRWLCRLVTPRGGTVLDPFMGSGSTLKAAELEGFGAIGIEINQEYIDIARKRIAADMPLFTRTMKGAP